MSEFFGTEDIVGEDTESIVDIIGESGLLEEDRYWKKWIRKEDEEDDNFDNGLFEVGKADHEKLRIYDTAIRNINREKRKISEEHNRIRLGEFAAGRQSELEKYHIKQFNDLEQTFKNKPAGLNDGVVYGVVGLRDFDLRLEYYTEPGGVAAYKIFNSQTDGTLNRLGYLKETDFVLNYLDGLNQVGKLKTWTVYENKNDLLVDVVKEAPQQKK
jgi:hypothetical protein